MDIFPVNRVSDKLEPLYFDADVWEKEIRQHRVQAFISFMEPHEIKRIFHNALPNDWFRKHLDNFLRCLDSAKRTSYFDPNKVQWDRIVKKLMKNPDRNMKNADTRMGFRLENMYLVKHGFTFGHWIVDPGTHHVFQTSFAPMVCYELPAASVDSPSQPTTVRRSLHAYDQMLYDRYVFQPHSTYTVPSGTRYVVMAVQKTLFSVDVVPNSVAIPGMESFKTHKCYGTSAYNVPPPSPTSQQRPAMVLPEQRRLKRKQPVQMNGCKIKIPKESTRMEPVHRPRVESPFRVAVSPVSMDTPVDMTTSRVVQPSAPGVQPPVVQPPAPVVQPPAPVVQPVVHQPLCVEPHQPLFVEPPVVVQSPVVSPPVVQPVAQVSMSDWMDFEPVTPIQFDMNELLFGHAAGEIPILDEATLREWGLEPPPQDQPMDLTTPRRVPVDPTIQSVTPMDLSFK